MSNLEHFKIKKSINATKLLLIHLLPILLFLNTILKTELSLVSIFSNKISVCLMELSIKQICFHQLLSWFWTILILITNSLELVKKFHHWKSLETTFIIQLQWNLVFLIVWSHLNSVLIHSIFLEAGIIVWVQQILFLAIWFKKHQLKSLLS